MVAAAVSVASAFSLNAQRQVDDAIPRTFKAGVDLVSLNVTVTDTHGRFLTELDTGDFSIFEDGVKQDLAVFARMSAPIALVILLDTSGSMQPKIKTAQQAAVEFARRLRVQDVAQVIGFESHVRVVQDFTNSVPELEHAIRSTTTGGSTSLFNAIYVALNNLARAPAVTDDALRRRAIVVLSDGEDTSSLLPFEETLDAAKRSDTSIYTILLRDPYEVHVLLRENEGEFVMKQFAQATGGRAFVATDISQLRGIYSGIADELSSQYLLGYTSNNRKADGRYRHVMVRAGRSNAVVRTRPGYYAPRKDPTS